MHSFNLRGVGVNPSIQSTQARQCEAIGPKPEPMRPSGDESVVETARFSQPSLFVGERRFWRQTNDEEAVVTPQERCRTDNGSFLAQTGLSSPRTCRARAGLTRRGRQGGGNDACARHHERDDVSGAAGQGRPVVHSGPLRQAEPAAGRLLVDAHGGVSPGCARLRVDAPPG